MDIEERSFSLSERAYFLKRVVFRSDLVHKIAAETVGQIGCELWWKMRRGRITASKFGAVLNAHKYNGYFKEGGRCVNSPALKWGRDNEAAAIELYETVMECSVERTGFHIHPSGALGSSPDGIIRHKRRLIEVKCPYKYKDCPSLDALAKSGRFYVKKSKNGANYLDRRSVQGHAYWHQIQGCLSLVADVDTCDLVVWTPRDLLIVTIERDAQWAKSVEPKLLKLWYREWLPKILDEGEPVVVSKVSHITNPWLLLTCVQLAMDFRSRQILSFGPYFTLSDWIGVDISLYFSGYSLGDDRDVQIHLSRCIRREYERVVAMRHTTLTECQILMYLGARSDVAQWLAQKVSCEPPWVKLVKHVQSGLYDTLVFREWCQHKANQVSRSLFFKMYRVFKIAVYRTEGIFNPSEVDDICVRLI